MTRRAKNPFQSNYVTARPKNYRPCDHEGCLNEGEFRAPKDRTLTDYYWFCLEHVQEYNARWDFYANMSPEEIEHELKEDVCWHRPTWKLGQRGFDSTMFNDPLGVKKEAFGKDGGESSRPAEPAAPFSSDPAVIAAVKTLEISFPLELEIVRASYKKLAKVYHPDSNGGSKEAEEKFKNITQAYRLIISLLNGTKA